MASEIEEREVKRMMLSDQPCGQLAAMGGGEGGVSTMWRTDDPTGTSPECRLSRSESRAQLEGHEQGGIALTPS